MTCAQERNANRPCPQWAFNSSTNQLRSSGFTYDAAGNVLNDGVYNYTWNAEGEVVTAAGVTYTYDGDGKRMKKSSGTLYWYSIVGDVLTETDGSGNLLNDYVYFAGGRIGRVNSSGKWFYYGDHLGSSRSITDSSGNLCYDADFYLFGAEKVVTNTCAQNYKWTGLERDSETGLDHTLNRQYSSNTGRWLSPDSIPGSASNPQSWNRYSYVVNNPINLTDRLGLYVPTYFSGCPQNGGGASCAQGTVNFGQWDASTNTNAVNWVPESLASPEETVFDALAGEPGTFLAVSNGSIVGGFSLDLWRQTHALLDKLSRKRQVWTEGEPVPALLVPNFRGATFVTMAVNGQSIGVIASLAAASQSVYNAVAAMSDNQRGFLAATIEAVYRKGRDLSDIAGSFPGYYDAIMQLQRAWDDFTLAAIPQASANYIPAPQPPTLQIPTTPLPTIPAAPIPPYPGP
jgi:RHS repeat-associated protein